MHKLFLQKSFFLAGLLSLLATPGAALAAPGDLVPAFDGDGAVFVKLIYCLLNS